MSGTRLHSLREGDRSEYFAQVLLSGLGLSTPIPRQEDIGFDFFCSIADQESGVLSFGSPYLVSVKSLSSPDVILEPTANAISQNSQRHIIWLYRQELPTFLGVVDKDQFRMEMFSLIPLWFIYYEGGPRCGALRLKPRIASTDLSDVGKPRDLGEIPDWPGMRRFEVDLGHPVAVVDLDTLRNVSSTAEVKKRLKRAARYALLNHVYHRLKVPYFYWFAKTQPGGGDIHPGFGCFSLPSDPAARIDLMKEVAPLLITLSLHYKEVGDHDALSAAARLLRELPAEHFPDVIRTTLPEIVP